MYVFMVCFNILGGEKIGMSKKKGGGYFWYSWCSGSW